MYQPSFSAAQTPRPNPAPNTMSSSLHTPMTVRRVGSPGQRGVIWGS